MAQTKYSVTVCVPNTQPIYDARVETWNSYEKVGCALPGGKYGQLETRQMYLSDQPIEVTQQNSTSCTLAGGSTNAWCELGNMSIANAQQISLAVGAVWAVAWGFKVLRKSISLKGPEE